MKHSLCFLGLLMLMQACKKETVVSETGNNYFMIYLNTSSTSTNTIGSTRYNENPNNIIITDDSILIKQGGLYHFEGNLYLSCVRDNATYPVSYDFAIRVAERTYTVAQGSTNRMSATTDIGGTNFSIDIPIEDNGGVRFIRNIYNASSGVVTTRFVGYLVRRI